MDYQRVFQEIETSLKALDDVGAVASYIPELSNVNPDKFAIYLSTVDHQNYKFGDFDEKFSIQSIAKIFSLALAFGIEGDRLWQRVGVEPSGTPFNSLVQLEYEKGIPRNPLINAGAIVICDILVSHLVKPKMELIEFVRKVSGDEDIDYCIKTAESEKLTGYKNAALINLMKAYGNIKNNIDTVLDFYFHLCSIRMSCRQLSRAFLFLACDGLHPLTHEKVISPGQSKRINAIMQLCGFYDEAGEFAFKVGLTGKSGVGGGIIAIHPGKYCIAVWSPKLNEKGNSYKGMKVLEMFTTKTQSSIF